MPSGSLESLEDARGIMARAMESSKGIRLSFETFKAMTIFRHRLYSCRHKLREEARTIFEKADLGYGKVPEDYLRIVASGQDQAGPFHLTLYKANPDSIEGLTEIEEL